MNSPLNPVSAFEQAHSIMQTTGQIYVVNGATAQAIANGAGYTHLTAFAAATGFNGIGHRMTLNAPGSQITILDDGEYKISFVVCGFSGTASTTFNIAAFRNAGIITEVQGMSMFKTASEVGMITGIGILDLATGNNISLRAHHDQGAPVNFTPVYASLMLEMTRRF
jgi:hypothetical protein